MTSSIRSHRGQAHHRLDADVRTPTTSRDLARATLADPQVTVDPQTRGDVVMVVNELVTGSYLAGATTIDLAMEVHSDRVVVMVRDDRPLGRTAPWSDRARELLLDAVSTHRSVTHDADGTLSVAHVLFPRPDRPRYLQVVR